MVLNTSQIIQLTETLHRMESLTGDAGYAVARSLKALDPEYEIAQSCRISIFKKYGTEQEDGSYVIRNDSDKKEDFIREMDELMAREVDVNLHQVLADKYNPDEIYCLSAQAIDYRVFEELMVESPEVTS